MRKAEIKRKTKETDIELTLDIEGGERKSTPASAFLTIC